MSRVESYTGQVYRQWVGRPRETFWQRLDRLDFRGRREALERAREPGLVPTKQEPFPELLESVRERAYCGRDTLADKFELELYLAHPTGLEPTRQEPFPDMLELIRFTYGCRPRRPTPKPDFADQIDAFESTRERFQTLADPSHLAPLPKTVFVADAVLDRIEPTPSDRQEIASESLPAEVQMTEVRREDTDSHHSRPAVVARSFAKPKPTLRLGLDLDLFL